MHRAYEQLTTRLAEVVDLYGAIAVLGCDHRTMMPRTGAEARAEQLPQAAFDIARDPAGRADDLVEEERAAVAEERQQLACRALLRLRLRRVAVAEGAHRHQ